MHLSGVEIVVEEFLDGEEASFFAFLDGSTCVALSSAQDHKAVGEGDVGPNTGGMGAYSPAPVVTAAIEAQVARTKAEASPSAESCSEAQAAPVHTTCARWQLHCQASRAPA